VYDSLGYKANFMRSLLSAIEKGQMFVGETDVENVRLFGLSLAWSHPHDLTTVWPHPLVSQLVIACEVDWAFCIDSGHAEQHAINTLKANGLAQFNGCRIRNPESLSASRPHGGKAFVYSLGFTCALWNSP
jgi:hypothetical protein